METFIRESYWYCTDFCINAANLLHMTYVEFNFWLFLVVFPCTFLVLLGLNLYRYVWSPLWKGTFFKR
jgi:hypothetical protein